MVGQVVGFERVDFTDKNGDSIKRTRLYITYENSSINGKGADMKYFSDDSKVKLPEIRLGGFYDFIYEVKGFSGSSVLTAVKPYKE